MILYIRLALDISFCYCNGWMDRRFFNIVNAGFVRIGFWRWVGEIGVDLYRSDQTGLVDSHDLLRFFNALWRHFHSLLRCYL
jgi:hypothetical protein